MAEPWHSGKTLNPEFMAVAREHAGTCVSCSMPPFATAKIHNQWRGKFIRHTGAYLPPTWLKPPKPIEKEPSPVVTESAQIQPKLFEMEETPVYKKTRPPRRKTTTGH
jgi:hypothetical protein